ncbi:hypothetical protein O181_030456 [Austropuccinia psidii MF-1]|uniref:Uncharacterized protein n=1 Tax=Austropuccinia psidii MF-1 TaxID=1389203 RepID=A0A9Q3CT12_9BASI|nr:hypothetical protein [Austropuccinia psidii MF-1]
MKEQLFSDLKYFIIQKEDKIEARIEQQEFNTKNENMAQVEEFNSPIYVRIGWEEYPVMAIMKPNIEENILPLEIGLRIGINPKKKNKTKHKMIMKKVQVVMPTDETIQIIKSLNLEDSEYFSQQNVVPQEDALINLPDEILDKLKPLEENILITNLDIINNLQQKESSQELNREEDNLLEIYDVLINLIQEEKKENYTINLLSINEEKKIPKNQ